MPHPIPPKPLPTTELPKNSSKPHIWADEYLRLIAKRTPHT